MNIVLTCDNNLLGGITTLPLCLGGWQVFGDNIWL
tara:strand:- start:1764 stop:1868 length:105 start_codon:yes stop_codon:yes gene_type:complete